MQMMRQLAARMAANWQWRLVLHRKKLHSILNNSRHEVVHRGGNSAVLSPFANDAEDHTLAHALKAIPEKGFKILRVVYNETTEPVAIITAYFE
jgi:Zn-finger domain-containing protein